MESRSATFTSADIIRNLPDLLEGREPVVRSEEFQRALRDSADLRAAVHAVAAMEEALLRGAITLRPIGSRHAVRIQSAVRTAHAYHRRELAELLFTAGRDITLGTAWENNLYVSPHFDCTPGRFEAQKRAILGVAELLGESARVVRQIGDLGNNAGRTPADHAWGRAARLFDIANDVHPGLFGVKYYQAFVADRLAGHTNAARWRSMEVLAASAADTGVSATQRGHAAVEAGDHNAALDCFQRAIRTIPESVFAPYYAMREALAVSSSGLSRRFADQLVVRCTTPRGMEIMAQQFSVDRESWAGAWTRSRSRVVELQRSLPVPLAAELERLQP